MTNSQQAATNMAFSNHEQEFGEGFRPPVFIQGCFVSVRMDKRVKTILQDHTGRIWAYFVF